MRAIEILNPGADSRLIISEQPVPIPKAHQLLVRVEATALNRADLLQRRGKYAPPKEASPIPGLELAGTVEAIGDQVTDFKPGDRVYGLVAGGAYADYCLVEDCLAHPLPEHWSFTQAAAIPEALTTVYGTLFALGQLKEDETLLIHAAGSGISTLAIQMAKRVGANVISTIGREEKREAALALGVDSLLLYKDPEWSKEIAPESVNLIVDFLGGDYFPVHLQLLAPQGRLVQMGAMAGNQVSFNLADLYRKRLTLHGFVLRSQSIQEKARLWKGAHAHWFEALSQDQISMPIAQIFAFEDIEKAHEMMLNSQHFGKIVIRVC